MPAALAHEAADAAAAPGAFFDAEEPGQEGAAAPDPDPVPRAA
jgi:hypothetical protein